MKAKQKMTGYATLVYRLRQDIDLYRVIRLNRDQLSVHGKSKAFWWYLEMLAHQSIAVTVCKIFERVGLPRKNGHQFRRL
jgi:hypothetical protein